MVEMACFIFFYADKKICKNFANSCCYSFLFSVCVYLAFTWKSNKLALDGIINKITWGQLERLELVLCLRQNRNDCTNFDSSLVLVPSCWLSMLRDHTIDTYGMLDTQIYRIGYMCHTNYFKYCIFTCYKLSIQNYIKPIRCKLEFSILLLLAL